jgi:chromosome segregation ATPase
MANVWDSFREIAAAAADWDSELQQTERAIEVLEAELDEKSAVLQTLQSQLDVFEDRQLRFRRLIEIFETASGQTAVADRKGELLHIAQSLYSALADHDRRIEKHRHNPETLKQLLFLLSDFNSRFQELKVTAFRRGVIPSTVAFEPAAANIAPEDPKP